jgi:hypothetical protein
LYLYICISYVYQHHSHHHTRYEMLLKNLLAGLTKLPSKSKKLLSLWIRDQAGSDRYRGYLGYLRQFMTLKIYQECIEDARLAVRGLALLHAVSEAYPEVNYSEFYNDALNEYYMHTREGVRMEYRHWIKDRQIIHILKTKVSKHHH